MRCIAALSTAALLPPSPQVAVVFSKVARFDFPKAWPTLFSDLLAKLQVGLRRLAPCTGLRTACRLQPQSLPCADRSVVQHGRVPASAQ